ncbi:HEAT repeat domain-containing protein [Blastopirellula marina]|nr:HEAT repeat domain-containing protein [Blastopirellula marina]
MRLLLAAVSPALLLGASVCWGQDIPGVGTTAAASAYPTAPLAPIPSAASGGFFSEICSCLHASHANCCNSTFGHFLHDSFAPVSMMTGGLLPPPCNSVYNQVKNGIANGVGPNGQPVSPAQAAAAKIAADQAQVPARVAAVKALACVDWHWYPEAEAALISSLRSDRSECVRFQAAIAFAEARTMTKAACEALRICAEGSDKDGNPSENSPRVRIMAVEALTHCIDCGQLFERPEDNYDRPEFPEGALPVNKVALTGYYLKASQRSSDELLAAARKTVSSFRAVAQQPAPTLAGGAPRTIFGLWKQSGVEPIPAGQPPIPTPAEAMAEAPSFDSPTYVAEQAGQTQPPPNEWMLEPANANPVRYSPPRTSLAPGQSILQR